MKLIWLFIGVGGFVGGYLPALFGQDSFSVLSLVGGMVGSLLGIWAYAKLDL